MVQSISGMSSGTMGMRSAQGRPDTRKIFNKMDANGDGALSATELQTMSDRMTEKMGGDAPSVDDIVAKLDSDSDSALSFAEFSAARPQVPPGGGTGGMMPPMGGYGRSNQMDLSSLFGASEDDSEAEEESIYAYA